MATVNNLTRGDYNGWISRTSRSKIRNSLEGWIKSIEVNRKQSRSKYKPKHAHLTFATLTLPHDQIHSDNEIKRKCLMPFIQRMQREMGVEEWFWKAEPQGSGNIHFHLLLDRYIDAQNLQCYWNLSTEYLGYLTRYFEKTGSLFPPSTDIRQCPEDLSLVRYVMKYVTKAPEIRLSCMPMPDLPGKEVDEDPARVVCTSAIGEHGRKVVRSRKRQAKLVRKTFWHTKQLKDGTIEDQEWRKIEGRVWGMSKGIRNCSVFSSELTDRLSNFANTLKWDPEVKILHHDHFDILYCNVQAKMIQYDRVLFSDYLKYYRDQYRALYVKSERAKPPEPPVIKLPKEKPKPPEQAKQLKLAVGY